MICPNCRHKNVPGGKFCSNCGKALPTSFICSNCGNEMSPDDRFCDICGAKNSAVGRQQSTRTGTAPRAARPQAPTRIYNPLDEAATAGRPVSPQISAEDYADDYAAGPSLPVREARDPYNSFSGDRYGQWDEAADYDEYGEYDDYDDYDEYDDYEEYGRGSKPGTAKTVLIIILAAVALVVVIGIISIISGFIKDSRGRMESGLNDTTTSTTLQTAPSTTRPSLTTTTTTVPTTTPTTVIETTTETTTLPPTTVPTGPMLYIRSSEGFVIRAGAGTSFDRLGIASTGMGLTILGEVEGETAEGFGNVWYQVDYNGQIGYVIKDTGGGQEVR